MTNERTKELEHVGKMIREMLEAHNCKIYVTEDLKATLIASNENQVLIIFY